MYKNLIDMENIENSVKGTKFKVNLNMTPIDGVHLADVDWDVRVFTDSGSKSQSVKKDEATKIDDDNYIIPIDSAICGSGTYFLTLSINIPDTHFADNIRTEVKTAPTGVTINNR